ncbi:MAG: CARDB domain-containing protein [Candidatus Aenigmarchaeota archaeon]|nr:CARDB domain-containing protein [Candidatus Aenigmarchaeota archaeon]
MKILLLAAVISLVIIAGCVQQNVNNQNNGSSNNTIVSPPAKNDTQVQPPADQPPPPPSPPPEPLINETLGNISAAPPKEEPVESPPISSDKRPDLVLEKIDLDPKTPLVNELVTFTATVKNAGYSSVSTFAYTLSPLTEQVSITSAASAGTTSLAAGDMTTIRMQAKIATPGPAKIKSTVDSFNKLDEINETNNQLIVPFRVYTKQSWAGCSGNGKSVCADLVTEDYFSNHTECKPAYNCTSFVTSCDAACPFPR